METGKILCIAVHSLMLLPTQLLLLTSTVPSECQHPSRYTGPSLQCTTCRPALDVALLCPTGHTWLVQSFSYPLPLSHITASAPASAMILVSFPLMQCFFVLLLSFYKRKSSQLVIWPELSVPPHTQLWPLPKISRPRIDPGAATSYHHPGRPL